MGLSAHGNLLNFQIKSYHPAVHSSGIFLCFGANGAAVMAVPVSDERVFAPVDIAVFVNRVMRAIQQFDLDHRIFAESLLLWNGTAFERDGGRLVAYFAQQRLMMTLENVGGYDRITNIKTI